LLALLESETLNRTTPQRVGHSPNVAALALTPQVAAGRYRVRIGKAHAGASDISLLSEGLLRALQKIREGVGVAIARGRLGPRGVSKTILSVTPRPPAATDHRQRRVPIPKTLLISAEFGRCFHWRFQATPKCHDPWRAIGGNRISPTFPTGPLNLRFSVCS
jgi:hypothetical protein